MDTAQRTTRCPNRRRRAARFGTLGFLVASVATESPSPAHRRQHGTVAPSHQLGRRQAIGQGRQALQTPPAPHTELGARGENGIEYRRRRRIAFEVRIAQAAVIVHMRDAVAIFQFQDQLDRTGPGCRGRDRSP
jgi:hypothetical protein